MGRCWVRPAGMSAGLVEATYAGGESASGPALTAHSLTHGPQCSRRPAPVSPTELGAPAFSWPPDAICVQISLEKNSPKVPPPQGTIVPGGHPPPCTTMSLFAYFGTPESRSFQFLWTAGTQRLFSLAFRLFQCLSHLPRPALPGGGVGGPGSPLARITARPPPAARGPRW